MNDLITLGAASYGSAVPEETAFNFLDVFFSNGGRRLDTAHVYASWLSDGVGASERCLGNWVKSRNIRDQVYIITKGAHPDLKTQEKRVSEHDIQSDLQDSLNRLQTDYIDLYLLHRDDRNVAVADIAHWMNKHIDEQSIKSFGVSNWDIDRLEQLCQYCDSHGLQGPLANQLGFSIARTVEDAGSHADTRYMTPEMFHWHQQRNIDVYCFSSQANGLFAKCPDHQSLMNHEKLNVYKTPANKSLFSVVNDIAKELDASPIQISLAALMHAPFPCYPVIGNSNMEQLVDSLGAADLELSDDQVSSLYTHWLK